MKVRRARSSGFEAGAARAASVLLMLVGLALAGPAARCARESRPFWTLFWSLSAAALVGFGATTLLYLSRRLAPPAKDVLRPLLLLGSLAAAIAGVGRALDALVLWRHTGDLEAFAILVGLVLAVQGSLTFRLVERVRLAAVR